MKFIYILLLVLKHSSLCKNNIKRDLIAMSKTKSIDRTNNKIKDLLLSFFPSLRAGLAGCDFTGRVHKSLTIINTMFLS